MNEIADFLRARYAERRVAIEAMPRGPWTWGRGEGDTDTYDCLSGPDGEVLSSGDAEGYRSWIDKHDALDGFLAVIQPEELLADLDAKLALVNLCTTFLHDDEGGTDPCAEGALRILARPFAGHPDHKGEEWAP